MKRNEKVVPYLDLPIQHCNDTILKNMNRRSTRAELLEVIGKLRREIPGITLRSLPMTSSSSARVERRFMFLRMVSLQCWMGRSR